MTIILTMKGPMVQVERNVELARTLLRGSTLDKFGGTSAIEASFIAFGLLKFCRGKTRRAA